MKRSVFAFCATILFAAAACGGGGTTAPATNTGGNNTGGNNTGGTGGNTTVPSNTVDATSTDTFTPSSLTVTVGTSVDFVFLSVGHNVVFNAVAGRPADIPGTNSSVTISRTFSTAGTFPYQCTIHGGMTGTIIVQ